MISRSKSAIYAFAVLLTLSILLGLFRVYPEQIRPYVPDRVTSILGPESRGPRVHFLLPTDHVDAAVCRVITSAIVNDYPAPYFINYGLHDGDPELNGYELMTGKNWGILKWLRSLPPQADNDLVLMVDAFDLTFQLPLSVLLERYQMMMDSSAALIKRQHSEQDIVKYNIKDTIYFGAEKVCWPLDGNFPVCYAVPVSTLRPDAWGPETDKTAHKSRPRWLNSGTVIAPVGDLRKLYEWTHVHWTAYPDTGKDQEYFGNIYGQQSFSRQILRGGKEWVFAETQHYEEGQLVKPHLESGHNDYHLALDHENHLWQVLYRAHGDMSQVIHSNDTQVDSEDQAHGTHAIYKSHFHFPDDLLRAPLPPNHPAHGHAGEPATWQDVPLWTNFHSRTIPIVLHHNGDKSQMNNWWDRQWWTGYARKMVEARFNDKENPYVMKTDNPAWPILKWQDICAAHEDKLF